MKRDTPSYHGYRFPPAIISHAVWLDRRCGVSFRDELQVDRVVLRIQANPQEPHSATADFDLVRLVAQAEVDRERWSLSLQFLFLEEIPPDLIVHNPMGIVIIYLQGDRAVVTGGR